MSDIFKAYQLEIRQDDRPWQRIVVEDRYRIGLFASDHPLSQIDISLPVNFDQTLDKKLQNAHILFLSDQQLLQIRLMDQLPESFAIKLNDHLLASNRFYLLEKGDKISFLNFTFIIRFDEYERVGGVTQILQAKGDLEAIIKRQEMKDALNSNEEVPKSLKQSTPEETGQTKSLQIQNQAFKKTQAEAPAPPSKNPKNQLKQSNSADQWTQITQLHSLNLYKKISFIHHFFIQLTEVVIFCVLLQFLFALLFLDTNKQAYKYIKQLSNQYLHFPTTSISLPFLGKVDSDLCLLFLAALIFYAVTRFTTLFFTGVKISELILGHRRQFDRPKLQFSALLQVLLRPIIALIDLMTWPFLGLDSVFFLLFKKAPTELLTLSALTSATPFRVISGLLFNVIFVFTIAIISVLMPLLSLNLTLGDRPLAQRIIFQALISTPLYESEERPRSFHQSHLVLKPSESVSNIIQNNSWYSKTFHLHIPYSDLSMVGVKWQFIPDFSSRMMINSLEANSATDNKALYQSQKLALYTKIQRLEDQKELLRLSPPYKFTWSEVIAKKCAEQINRSTSSLEHQSLYFSPQFNFCRQQEIFGLESLANQDQQDWWHLISETLLPYKNLKIDYLSEQFLSYPIKQIENFYPLFSSCPLLVSCWNNWQQLVEFIKLEDDLQLSRHPYLRSTQWKIPHKMNWYSFQGFALGSPLKIMKQKKDDLNDLGRESVLIKIHRQGFDLYPISINPDEEFASLWTSHEIEQGLLFLLGYSSKEKNEKNKISSPSLPASHFDPLASEDIAQNNHRDLFLIAESLNSSLIKLSSDTVKALLSSRIELSNTKEQHKVIERFLQQSLNWSEQIVKKASHADVRSKEMETFAGPPRTIDEWLALQSVFIDLQEEMRRKNQQIMLKNP